MRQEFGPRPSFKSAPGRVSVLGWVNGGSKWELRKTSSRPSPQMFALGAPRHVHCLLSLP